MDEKILCIQSKMREMMGSDKTPQDESNCLSYCEENGMCLVCMFGRVYKCISTEHCTIHCTTPLEVSTRISRLKEVVEFIDHMKKNNHHLTDSD